MATKNKKKLKRAIYLLGIFLVLSILFCVGALYRGVHIQQLTFRGIVFKGCIIRWQEGLHLDINTLSTTSNKSSPRATSSPNNVKLLKYLGLLEYFDKAVTSVKIRSIDTSVFRGEFHYDNTTRDKPALLQSVSPDLHFLANISRQDNKYILNIVKLQFFKYKSSLKGEIIIDMAAGLVSGELQAKFADDSLPLHLRFSANSQGVTFAGEEAGVITEIKPFVDMLQIDPDITPWISEYLQGSRYRLKKFKGRIPWDDPATILDTFYAEGRVDDCQYTFAEGFKPISSKYTEVVFEKGILKIFPHGATFYGQDCEESWLDIDFNNPAEPILNAYITTHAVFNQDILNLLKFYDIDLPILQLSGDTDSDLTLSVNLQTEEVEAVGGFFFSKGVLRYKGKDFQTSGGKVLLENSKVTISNVRFSLADLSSKLSGTLDFSKETGVLNFDLENFTYKSGKRVLRLDTKKSPVKLAYIYDPQGDRVALNKSNWVFNSLKIQLDAFSAPFDYRQFSVSLPSTRLAFAEQNCTIYLTGDIFINQITADLWLDVVQYKHNQVELKQPHWKMHVLFDQELRLFTEEDVAWTVKGIDTVISPLEISFQNDELTIKEGGIEYGNFFAENIHGQMDVNTGKGVFYLTRAMLKNDSFGTLLAFDKQVEVNLERTLDGVITRLPVLQTEIRLAHDNAWIVTCHNLEALHMRSPFLQRFALSQGNFSFGSYNGEKPYTFSGKIISDYRILVEGDLQHKEYTFTGEIGEESISAILNDKISIRLADKIEIHSVNMEYNVGELLRYIDSRPQTKIDSPQSRINMEIIAQNTSLFLREGNRAIADILYINVQNGRTSMKLEHKEGRAWLLINNQELVFAGENFEESFVEGLLREANFSGGNLSFTGSGTIDNFSGMFLVKDTVLEDYSIINNIFAFVDTIPALITFSLPDYSAKGMAVSSAILNVKYVNKIFGIDALAIDTKTLDMYGNGTANLIDDTIDMDINLITTAKENISKIPLVGYVLVGETKLPSITLKVSGKLYDPKVSNTAFKDYIVWPVETIFRVFKLPFNIIEGIFSRGGENMNLPDTYPFPPANETNSE